MRLIINYNEKGSFLCKLQGQSILIKMSQTKWITTFKILYMDKTIMFLFLKTN